DLLPHAARRLRPVLREGRRPPARRPHALRRDPSLRGLAARRARPHLRLARARDLASGSHLRSLARTRTNAARGGGRRMERLAMRLRAQPTAAGARSDGAPRRRVPARSSMLLALAACIVASCERTPTNSDYVDA